MPIFLRSFIVAMAIVGANCGGSPTAPRFSSGPGGSDAPLPAAILSIIKIGTSALVMRAPGETGQLTVEAFFTNGTSLDRTVEAQWTTQDPSVVTVAPGGVVTAVGIGATHIDAAFDGKRSTVDVLVTPPGSFAFLGQVREPGIGPMAGVLVQELRSGRSTTTDQNGQFGFAGLQQARFRVARDGFEVVEVDAVPRPADANLPRLSVDILLQRIVRLDAGASRSQLTIAADDVYYSMSGGGCWPCKLIRVATGRSGTLRVTVTPQQPISSSISGYFHVWIDGRGFSLSSSSISAQSAVAGSGEALVYVGWSLGWEIEDPGPVSFGITTSIDDP